MNILGRFERERWLQFFTLVFPGETCFRIVFRSKQVQQLLRPRPVGLHRQQTTRGRGAENRANKSLLGLLLKLDLLSRLQQIASKSAGITERPWATVKVYCVSRRPVWRQGDEERSPREPEKAFSPEVLLMGASAYVPTLPFDTPATRSGWSILLNIGSAITSWRATVLAVQANDGALSPASVMPNITSLRHGKPKQRGSTERAEPSHRRLG